MIFNFIKNLFKKHSSSLPHTIETDSVSIAIPENINLDTFKLGHTRVGEPVCGQDSYFSPKGELWVKNLSEGIEVGVKNGLLEFIYLNLAKYNKPITLDGQEITLNNLTTDAWKSLYGEAYWYDPDGNEELQFYEPVPEKIEVQAEFENGLLSHLLITSEPLMASEEQRYAYGVTKLWPPVEN